MDSLGIETKGEGWVKFCQKVSEKLNNSGFEVTSFDQRGVRFMNKLGTKTAELWFDGEDSDMEFSGEIDAIYSGGPVFDASFYRNATFTAIDINSKEVKLSYEFKPEKFVARFHIDHI